MDRQIIESREITDINKLEYWNLNNENLISKFLNLEKDNKNLAMTIKSVVDKNKDLIEKNADLKKELEKKDDEIKNLKIHFGIQQERLKEGTSKQNNQICEKSSKNITKHFLKDNLGTYGSNVSSILNQIISERQGSNIICIIDENRSQYKNSEKKQVKGKIRKQINKNYRIKVHKKALDGKSKNDKSKIKKFQTPYICYNMRRYKEVAKEHPNLGMSEIVRLISTEWSSMSEEEKKPYMELSNIDKSRYQKEKIGNTSNLKNEN